MFFENVTPLETALREGRLPALETFSSPFDASTDHHGILRIIFPEFTCVCPRTGYPDFASIGVFYLPGERCIELKSWKLYLNAFRMIGTFHETVTGHLYSTLKQLLEPKWLFVVGDFFPRGNIDTTVLLESPGQRPRGADLLIETFLSRTKSSNG